MTRSRRLPRRAGLRCLVVLGLVLLVSFAGAIGGSHPAVAATTGSWAVWSPLSGTGGNYAGTVRIADTPSLTATFASDSRAPATIPSGSSTWLGTDTPVGAAYGSSRNRPYLNLRPRQDTANAPSVTTYTFDRPTPRSGWTFVLGDVDADQVLITATAPDGSEVPAVGLGFRGVFNYCSGCAEQDLPSWNPSTQVLSGNAAAVDTVGASAWFEPTVPLETLTFTFRQRAGFPIYQTWFASLARDITGTVTDQGAAGVAAVPVELRDEYGDVIGTTTTDSAGGYSFAGIVATDGYTVSVSPAAGTTSDELSLPADLATADAVVDFVVRDLDPVTVSGTVSDTDGEPIAGVPVSLGESADTQTSAPDGSFSFSDVPPGTYQTEIAVPAGYTLEESPPAFTVPSGSEEPVTDQDFVLAAVPTPTPTPTGSITGSVSDADGSPVGGGVVEIEGPTTVTATVNVDGEFAVEALPLGAYDVTLTPPVGFTVIDATVSVEVGASGGTVAANFIVTAVPSPDPSAGGGGGAGTPAPGTVSTPAGGAGSSGTLPDAGGEFPVGPAATGTGLLILGAAVMALPHARRRRAASHRS